MLTAHLDSDGLWRRLLSDGGAVRPNTPTAARASAAEVRLFLEPEASSLLVCFYPLLLSVAVVRSVESVWWCWLHMFEVLNGVQRVSLKKGQKKNKVILFSVKSFIMLDKEKLV